MKWRSILEVSTVFLVFSVITKMIPGVRAFIRWETRFIGASFFTGGLMLLLAVIAVIASGLEFQEIGLTLYRWRSSVNVGFKGYLAFLGPQFVMTYFTVWSWDYRENQGYALFVAPIVLLMGFILSKNLGNDPKKMSQLRLGLIVLGFITPLALAYNVGSLSGKLVNYMVWQIMVGGFSEEFMYRGYIQSRVNAEYGRHWTFSEIKMGPGIIVSSLLYGLSRAMDSFNPLRGDYTLNIAWGLFAFTVGLFYGMIREATEDIVGSTTANALIDGIGATVIRSLR